MNFLIKLLQCSIMRMLQSSRLIFNCSGEKNSRKYSLANNRTTKDQTRKSASCERNPPGVRGENPLNSSRVQSRPKFRSSLKAYLRRKLGGTGRLGFNFRNDATPSGKRAVYFAAVFYKGIKQRVGKGGGKLL